MLKPRLSPLLRPRGFLPRMRTQHFARRPNSTNTQSRADKILSRLPARMQKYTTRLRGAPISHVVAFLILHELTAVVPLVALFGLFHYTDYVPLGYMMANYGGYVREGVGRFERYFTRKGWFGFGGANDAGGEVKGVMAAGAQGEEDVMDRWESSDGKYRVVVEVALAYAITKALLPVRILGSVWATPWFAGLLARIRGIVSIAKKK